MMSGGAVEVIPVGGLGRFGMNCTLIRSGDDVLIIDAGLMFPQGGSWGVDAIIPDLSIFLGDGPRPAAIVLTHGHDDHIGGVPFLMATTECPVYGSDLTLAFLKTRLPEGFPGASERLRRASPGARIQAGPFAVEFLHVTHSVPGSFSLAITTPVVLCLPNTKSCQLN